MIQKIRFKNKCLLSLQLDNKVRVSSIFVHYKIVLWLLFVLFSQASWAMTSKVECISVYSKTNKSYRGIEALSKGEFRNFIMSIIMGQREAILTAQSLGIPRDIVAGNLITRDSKNDIYINGIKVGNVNKPVADNAIIEKIASAENLEKLGLKPDDLKDKELNMLILGGGVGPLFKALTNKNTAEFGQLKVRSMDLIFNESVLGSDLLKETELASSVKMNKVFYEDQLLDDDIRAMKKIKSHSVDMILAEDILENMNLSDIGRVVKQTIRVLAVNGEARFNFTHKSKANHYFELISRIYNLQGNEKEAEIKVQPDLNGNIVVQIKKKKNNTKSTQQAAVTLLADIHTIDFANKALVMLVGHRFEDLSREDINSLYMGYFSAIIKHQTLVGPENQKLNQHPNSESRIDPRGKSTLGMSLELSKLAKEHRSFEKIFKALMAISKVDWLIQALTVFQGEVGMYEKYGDYLYETILLKAIVISKEKEDEIKILSPMDFYVEIKWNELHGK